VDNQKTKAAINEKEDAGIRVNVAEKSARQRKGVGERSPRGRGKKYRTPMKKKKLKRSQREKELSGSKAAAAGRFRKSGRVVQEWGFFRNASSDWGRELTLQNRKQEKGGTAIITGGACFCFAFSLGRGWGNEVWKKRILKLVAVVVWEVGSGSDSADPEGA